MEVARSNHSNASCFSDKPCNSPRFIKQISGDEQSLGFRFSGFIRILCLCLIHECEAGAPFQLRQCKAYKASQTLDSLKSIAMLLKTANWGADVKQQCKPAFSRWQPRVATVWGDVVAGSDVPWCPMLRSWLCKAKERLPRLPGCGASALPAVAGNLLQQVFPCFNLCLRFEDESQEDET